MESVPPFLPLDTSPEALARQTEAYRRMSGQERTAVMYRLNALAREMSLAGIRARHPSYTDDEMKRALFRLMHGDVLTREVWPDQPLIAP